MLFPALSPTDGRGDGVNDLDYLQGVYDAGGREQFDIMSAQLYGLGQPPTEHRYVRPGSSPLQPIETKTDVGRVVLLREIMVRNGDERKAIWVSELGWNSAPKSIGPAALTCVGRDGISVHRIDRPTALDADGPIVWAWAVGILDDRL